MLYSTSDLTTYDIAATDGSIGHMRGFYFDPESWVIHYLIVDTSEWLPGRKVIISLAGLGKLDAKNRSFIVSLSKEQIKDSPAIEEDGPIASLHELKAYYGWQFSLGGDMPSRSPEVREGEHSTGKDIELRSTHELVGFDVLGRDGAIGRVEDFIIDDDHWMIRFVVIDSQEGRTDRKVLIYSGWIDETGWQEKKIYVSATRSEIRDAPEYDPSLLGDKEYEQELDDYFRKSLHWGWPKAGERERSRHEGHFAR